MTDANAEIAASYDAKVDGFSRLEIKRLRNPEHPAVVWMSRETWQRLATHATRDGEFYIPCKEGLLEPADLRNRINQMEIAS